jgi:hypothetical protein
MLGLRPLLATNVVMLFSWALCICLPVFMSGCGLTAPQRARVELRSGDATGTLTVAIDGNEAITYQYDDEYAIPHIWPLRSPTGRLLTVQHPDPYPHHRSLWIADKVQLGDGPVVDFYHCWSNLRDSDRPELGYRHFIRHCEFLKCEAKADRATVTSSLRWIVDEQNPVLDEVRTMRVTAFEDGEYLLDLTWKLTATYGNVQFCSDWVHYAWPYLRMRPEFSGEHGGTIIDDRGRRGQELTNGMYANWIDYFNTVEGVPEGLAVFIHPDGDDHKWLTREYGTFGPRRSDRLSGTGFTLRRGDSLMGRVGILVHRGDAHDGRVVKRYRQYVESD